MKDKLMPWRKQTLRREPEREDLPFDALHREVNDLFETYFNGAYRSERIRAGSVGFEVSETDEDVRVKVELPGMDKNNIQIDLEENMLTVRAERKQQKETKKRNVHIAEMSCGRFQRTIPLPAKVDADEARAKFRRGVLTLTLPKTQQAKEHSRRIEVTRV